MKNDVKISEKDREELDKPEKLLLVCHKCNCNWVEIRPKGYCVRHNRKGNFLVNINKSTDIKFFKCPKCGEQKKIGRLAYNKINMNKKVVINE